MPTGTPRSPFQEGFGALREEPLLLPAELMWRWCFGITACLLSLCAATIFLDSIKVSALESFLLLSLRPRFELVALDRLLPGLWLRAAWIKLVLLTVLTLVWAVAAAAGRAASLRRLVALAGGDDDDELAGWQFRPMLQLHLVRALWNWIALSCLVASFLLGAAMQQKRAADAAFFYVFGVVLSTIFGVVLNWFFGLAPLFCIRNQANAPDAVSLTLDFCARQGGRLLGLSLAFLGLRLLWAGSMFFLVLAPTSLGKHIALGWVLLMMGAFFLIYLTGAAALHLARLGAYAALADIDSQPTPVVGPEAPPQLTMPYPPIQGFEEYSV